MSTGWFAYSTRFVLPQAPADPVPQVPSHLTSKLNARGTEKWHSMAANG
jgi:hypothetical protein